MTPPLPSAALRRRLLGLLLLVLTAAILSGCGGGGASLPTSTTPIIDSFTANGVAVVFSGTVVPIIAAPTNSLTSLVCTAHDPDHSPLTFAWTGINGTIATLNGASTAGDTPTTDGDTLVTCTVTNVRGNSVARTVTLRAGAPPMTALTLGLTPASGVVGRGKTDLLTAIATGSNPLTYHFSVVTGTGTVLQSAVNPAQAIFTAPAAPETDTVLCYVTDMQGRSNTATTVILVQ